MPFPDFFFFSSINVVTSLDKSEAIIIVECKDVLNNLNLKMSLFFIASNFLVMQPCIKKLKTRGLALASTCQLVSEVEQEFDKLYDNLLTYLY